MPTPFDEFTERAHRSYTGGTPKSRENRDLLEQVMQQSGFKGFEFEWWHFDHHSWEKRPLLDIALT